MKKLLSILPILIAFGLSSCTSTNEKLTEEGVSLALAKYRKSTISDIQYHLNINIPEDRTAAIQGHEVVTFKLKESGPVILDFKVPNEYLLAIHANGQPIEYTFEKEHIILDDGVEIGENSIEIEFQVGETSLNRNNDYLYTLLVPERARTAFPCFDQPNLKAAYQLTLEIPTDWHAIANGPLVEEKITGNSKLLAFAETKAISTYLFDFVAGEFNVVEREVDGRKMQMLHRETDSLKVARNLDTIFALHKVALDWLEEYTDIPYPFQKFGFALIPSFQYGGMEHPGAITYKAESLFLDEAPTQNQLLGRASVIAHETAHMWFGDMVTMDWFSDVWMKEVFANFMAAKIVNPSFPEINHDLRFLLAHYPAAYAVDRTQGTHPIQQELDNLKDAGSLYGSIIYQKAPIVMRMLERKVGEEQFREGIRTYLSKYAFANATWDDLVAEIDAVSDEDLQKWSRQWIKNAGMPVIFPFLRTADDGTIKQFSLYQRNAEDNKDLWSQDLDVLLETSDSIYTKLVTLDGNGINIDDFKGLEDAAFIMCNSDGVGYGYFRLGPLTTQRWLKHVEDFKNPVHRGVGWLSMYESMLRRSISTEDYMKTALRNLKVEPDPLIQQYILGTFRTVYWRLINQDDRERSASLIEDVLWNRIVTMQDNRLKRAYFNTYRSIALSEHGVKRLYDLWQGHLAIEGLTLSESDRTTLACELAVRNWPKAEQIINQQWESISNADRKARLAFIRPSLAADKNVRDAFFESLKQPENREHESWVQTAIGYLHHPLRSSESVAYIRPTLDMLEEIQATGDIFFPKRVLDNTFYGHSSYEAVDAVRQFMFKNNHYPKKLKNKILQSTDLTFRAYERLNDRADSVKIVLE